MKAHPIINLISANVMNLCANYSHIIAGSPQLSSVDDIARIAWQNDTLVIWDGIISDTTAYYTSVSITPAIIFVSALLFLFTVDGLICCKPMCPVTPLPITVAFICIAVVASVYIVIGNIQFNNGLAHIEDGANNLKGISQLLGGALYSVSNDTLMITDIINDTKCLELDSDMRKPLMESFQDIASITYELAATSGQIMCYIVF